MNSNKFITIITTTKKIFTLPRATYQQSFNTAGERKTTGCGPTTQGGIFYPREKWLY
jgi:hypothetical protein